MTIRSLACAGLFFLAGCGKQYPVDGLWLGSLTLQDSTRVQFTMELKETDGRLDGAFIVGNERTQIPEIFREKNLLTFRFDEYGALMTATIDKGEMEGTYLRFRADTTRVPFTAGKQLSAPEVNSSLSTTFPRLSGLYQAYFLTTTDGIDSSSIGSFEQNGDSVSGTFLNPEGDFGLYAGTRHGSTIHLHQFNGWQLSAIVLQYQTNYWSGKRHTMRGSTQFTLHKMKDDARPAENRSPVTLLKNLETFSFSGTDRHGKKITSADIRFAGKPLIVEIMGTWCHNCNDAAVLLQSLYAQNKQSGLEVVLLAFEITDDPVKGQKNISLFSQRHGLNFPVLFSGSIKQANGLVGSQLENFGVYPTTLFIDRSGKVKAIESGFSGPATGKAYLFQQEKYKNHIRSIL